MRITSAIYTKPLQAYSLVEAIVASVIFMLIFLIGMNTLTRLAAYDLADTNDLVMENELQKLCRDITLNGSFPTEQDYIHGWGDIHIHITPYKDNVHQIELTAVSKRKHKTIGYRFLQAAP